jgi:hypothetical protein
MSGASSISSARWADIDELRARIMCGEMSREDAEREIKW